MIIRPTNCYVITNIDDFKISKIQGEGSAPELFTGW